MRDEVFGVAHQPARAAVGVPGGRRLADAGATGVGVGVVGQAPGAFRRGGRGGLIHALQTRQAAQLDVVVEVHFQHAGQHVHVDLLTRHIAIAVIGFAVHARQRAIVERAERERHAVLRQVVVVLVQVAQREARIRAQAEGDRRRKAPAMAEFFIAARHVLGVTHRVQAHGGAVFEVVVAVDREAAITVAAAADQHVGEVALPGGLGHQVDVAADRTGTGHRRVGAVDQLHGLKVEGIAAAVLRAVAHAIGGDVAAGGETTQIDAVAIPTAAFARAEGDAGQRAQHIAQRQQILLVHGLLGDNRDGLRSVAQRFGVLGRGRLLRTFLLHPDGIQIHRTRRRRRIARLGERRSGQGQQHGRSERGNPGSHETSRKGKRCSGLAMARRMRKGVRASLARGARLASTARAVAPRWKAQASRTQIEGVGQCRAHGIAGQVRC